VPLPSAPHRPFLLTLVGTAGAVDDGEGVGVGDGVGVGVGVGVRILEDENMGEELGTIDEELGTGIGTDEDTGGATPSHVPKALRHPTPQYAEPVPQ
jgi:hypothetical protein